MFLMPINIGKYLQVRDYVLVYSVMGSQKTGIA